MTVTQDIEMKKLLTEQKKMEIELVQKDEAINRYKNRTCTLLLSVLDFWESCLM